jgi:hypothetical protein
MAWAGNDMGNGTSAKALRMAPQRCHEWHRQRLTNGGVHHGFVALADSGIRNGQWFAVRFASRQTASLDDGCLDAIGIH